MAGSLTARTFRQSRYSGTPLARLWRPQAALVPFMAAALTLALASGGCSFSYQLGSLFGKDKDDETVTSTGSISAARQARSTDGSAVKSTEQAASPAPVDGDLDYARAAASEVLTSGRKDTSMPWQNPKTGARGTVTPLASAYNQDGMLCRDFLASYVRDGSESWLQGEACRKQQGKWEVRSLKPWKRS